MGKNKNLYVFDTPSTLKWWQLAFISIGVSFLGALSGGLRQNNNKKLYNVELNEAPWAPPSWVFAPAWTINNFFLLAALQRILRAKKLPEKKKLLLLQGAIWVIFFSFNYVYFRKKSPVLAAIWTQADSVLALASFLMAIKNDKKTAYSYLPLLIWTFYAATLADYQALTNADPLLKTKALLG